VRGATVVASLRPRHSDSMSLGKGAPLCTSRVVVLRAIHVPCGMSLIFENGAKLPVYKYS